MRNIGGRLRTLRAERGLTLPDLAIKAELSKGILSKLENNQNPNPSLDTLYKIAEALDVTLAEILESEQVQVTRVVPETVPAWQAEVMTYLKGRKKEPDQDILNALYMMRNRKGSKNADPESWIHAYISLENSFKK